MLYEFLESYSTESELAKDIISNLLECGTNEELENYIKNIMTYGLNSGIVSSLIYTDQCNEFFKKHYEEIFEIYNLANEYGYYLESYSATNLVYFTFEYIVCNLYEEYISCIEQI